jgi:FixJ family two-component response regulator
MSDHSFEPVIYLVDDKASTAYSLAAVLRSNGLNPAPFTNPRAALSQAKLNPPQLLITSLVMNDMSGVELAVAMNKVAPSCLFLFLSETWLVERLLNRVRRLGFSDCSATLRDLP